MLDQCPHCQKTYVESNSQGGRCPLCNALLSLSESGETSKNSDLESFSPLMENPQLGLLGRFWGTLAQVLFRPTLFFHSLAAITDKRPTSEKAFYFGVWCVFLGQGLSAFWVMNMSGDSLHTVFQGNEHQALWAGLLGIDDKSVAQEQITYFIHLASIQAHLEFILAPLIAFFAVHLLAGGCFWLSRLFAQDQEGPHFDFTLRWVAYAQAPFVLAIFPSLGSLIATGWVGMLLIRGLVVFHQMRFFSAFLTIISLGTLLKVLWSGVLHRLSLQIVVLFFPNLS